MRNTLSSQYGNYIFESDPKSVLECSGYRNLELQTNSCKKTADLENSVIDDGNQSISFLFFLKRLFQISNLWFTDYVDIKKPLQYYLQNFLNSHE